MLVCPAWYASRTSSFRHDTVWSNFISRRYAVMSFVCTNHSICIVTICNHVSAPSTLDACLSRMICITHEFVSTRYGMIQFHLDTICCHDICLHESLDMYWKNIFLCYRNKLLIRVCPASHASRTSSFGHNTCSHCSCLVFDTLDPEASSWSSPVCPERHSKLVSSEFLNSPWQTQCWSFCIFLTLMDGLSNLCCSCSVLAQYPASCSKCLTAKGTLRALNCCMESPWMWFLNLPLSAQQPRCKI